MTAPDFAALQTNRLKARGNKGDGHTTGDEQVATRSATVVS